MDASTPNRTSSGQRIVRPPGGHLHFAEPHTRGNGVAAYRSAIAAHGKSGFCAAGAHVGVRDGHHLECVGDKLFRVVLEAEHHEDVAVSVLQPATLFV